MRRSAVANSTGRLLRQFQAEVSNRRSNEKGVAMDSKSKSLAIRYVLEEFNGPDGVFLYDFGGFATVMPICNAEGSYTTSSICFLVKKKSPDSVIKVGQTLPHPGSAAELDGCKIFGVEFNYMHTPEQIRKMLSEAKAKLLEA
jgi:hypothetical protein